MTQKQKLLNFVNGQWQRSRAGDALDVLNPATGAAIATVGLSPAAEVDAAVRAGLDAYAEWRETPVVDRVQPLFRLEDAVGRAPGRHRARNYSPKSAARPLPRA